MTTFGGMRNQILTEIVNAAGSDLVELAIQAAVRFYENERFWFNETLSVTFTTSSSAEYYDATDDPSIPLMREIDNVEVSVSGNRYPLTRRHKAYLDGISGSPIHRGLPHDYSYEAGKLRFYPIPDGAYVVRVSGVIAPATLSASADTNFWTNEAQDLIRHRARADLWAISLMNPEAGMVSREAERQTLQTLRESTVSRLSTGKVRGTDF